MGEQPCSAGTLPSTGKCQVQPENSMGILWLWWSGWKALCRWVEKPYSMVTAKVHAYILDLMNLR